MRFLRLPIKPCELPVPWLVGTIEFAGMSVALLLWSNNMNGMNIAINKPNKPAMVKTTMNKATSSICDLLDDDDKSGKSKGGWWIGWDGRWGSEGNGGGGGGGGG